jgi:hypothetical protein
MAVGTSTSPSTVATPQQHILSECQFLNKYASQLGYSEGGNRMEGEKMTWAQLQSLLEGHGEFEGDCSSTVTEILRWAGYADPNGQGYDGEGYTGTIMDHLPEIPQAQIALGSIGIYGKAPGVHAIMALEAYKGDATSIWSHGAPQGAISTLGYLNSGFVGVPLTWYSIDGLAPAAPKSMHYERFDATRVALANGTNSERNVVENYDLYMEHPQRNAEQLKTVHANLVALLGIEQNLATHPGVQNAWVRNQLALRIAGKVVQPS